MKVKSHISVVEYATLIGDVYEGQDEGERKQALRNLRRRCQRTGLAERAPGMRRHLRVSTKRIREMERETYDRLRTEIRFWEDGCPHPVARVELIAPGVKWCGGCGAVHPGTAWRLPWRQQREEL